IARNEQIKSKTESIKQDTEQINRETESIKRETAQIRADLELVQREGGRRQKEASWERQPVTDRTRSRPTVKSTWKRNKKEKLNTHNEKLNTHNETAEATLKT